MERRRQGNRADRLDDGNSDDNPDFSRTPNNGHDYSKGSCRAWSQIPPGPGSVAVKGPLLCVGRQVVANGER
jgi:hypothetical protein